MFEETVQKVFQVFASQVEKKDGRGVIRTSAGAAAMEIAMSRWAAQLRASFVEEFCLRDSTNRNETGSLCGMISARSALKDPAKLDTWLSKLVEKISTGSEPVAIDAALTVMILAFENNRVEEDHQGWPDLALHGALLSRLEDSAPMAHAAAWALGWLNNTFVSKVAKNKDVWSKPEYIERILVFIGKSESDPEAVRFLTWIVGDKKIAAAVESLLKWLDHPNPYLRRDVAAALDSIGSERSVKPLIGKLEDPEVEVRRLALQALSRDLEKIDRILLTEHLNGVPPFLDPCSEIPAKFANKAAKKQGLMTEEVQKRYEALAKRFHLHLAWRDHT